MGVLFISLLTLVLLLVSAFVVMIILMQRTSQSGGMGAALGGGAAESAFGAETNNILTKGTIYGIIIYFVVALALFLIYQAREADRPRALDTDSLVTMEAAEPEAAESEAATTETEAAPEAIAEEGSETTGGTIRSLSESESVEADAEVAPAVEPTPDSN